MTPSVPSVASPVRPIDQVRRGIIDAKRIFIAYGHDDLDAAKYVLSAVRRLRRSKSADTVFMDLESRKAGEQAQDTLIEIDRADVVVVLCGSTTSEGRTIKMEIAHALRRRAAGLTHVFPIILKPRVRLPEGIENQVQAIALELLFPRRGWFIPILAACATLLVGAIVVTLVVRSSDRRVRRSEALEKGRAELLANQPLQAALDLAEAHELGATGSAFHFLLGDAMRVVDSLRGRLRTTARALAVSPDGSEVVMAERDGRVSVWSTATQQVIRAWSAHRGWIESAQLGRDGRTLITIGRDDFTVRLWDVSTGGRRAIFENCGWRAQGADRVPCVAALSSDNQWVAVSAANHPADVFDARSGARVATFDGDDARVRAIDFSVNGMRVVTSRNSVVEVWDTMTGRRVRRFAPLDTLRSVALDRVGERVVVTTLHDAVVQRVADGKQLRTVSNGDDFWIDYARFSPDGERIVTVDPSRLRLWPIAGGPPLDLRGEEHAASIGTDSQRLIAFSPDGERLARVTGEATADVWDTVTGELLFSVRDAGGFQGPAISADARVAVLSTDPAAAWDLSGTRLLWSRRVPKKETPWMIPLDGTRVFATDGETYAEVLDAETNRTVTGFPLQAHWSASDDGEDLVFWQPSGVTEDKRLRGVLSMWSSRDGSPVLERSIEGGPRNVTPCIALHDRIAAIACDGSLRVVDLRTGKLLSIDNAQDPQVGRRAFTADGAALLFLAGGRANLWRWREERVPGHSWQIGFGSSDPAALSPDGGRAITVRSFVVTLWDAATGARLLDLRDAGACSGRSSSHPTEAVCLR